MKTLNNKTLEQVKEELNQAVAALEVLAIRVEKATAVLALINQSTQEEIGNYTN